MHPDFKLPAKMTIRGRSSSITAAFFTAITPVIEPTDAEVEESLKILGMSRGNCLCAYCGGTKSEWDHFRPIVENKLPTGFITEIANLIPSCGKCNQSKGNKHWKEWMETEKGAMRTQSIPGVEKRMERLDAYEKRWQPVRLDYKEIVGEELWAKHLANWDAMRTVMTDAQSHAEKLRDVIKTHLRK